MDPFVSNPSTFAILLPPTSSMSQLALMQKPPRPHDVGGLVGGGAVAVPPNCIKGDTETGTLIPAVVNVIIVDMIDSVFSLYDAI